MRNLDILAAENGEHVRVLLCGEEQRHFPLILKVVRCLYPLHF